MSDVRGVPGLGWLGSRRLYSEPDASGVMVTWGPPVDRLTDFVRVCPQLRWRAVIIQTN